MNPIDYTSGFGSAIFNGIQTGNTILNMRQQAEQAEAAKRQQAEEDARKNAFLTKFKTAYDSGNDDQILSLMGEYPEQMSTITNALNIKDAATQKKVGNALRDMRIAFEIGGENIPDIVRSYEDVLPMLKTNADEVLRKYEQDPDGTKKLFHTLGLVSLGEKYYDVESARENREAQDKIMAAQMQIKEAELAQKSQTEAEKMKLDRTKLALDIQDKSLNHDLKREELNYKRDESLENRGIKREELDLKRSESELKQQETLRKRQIEEDEKFNKIQEEASKWKEADDTFASTEKTINELLNKEGINQAFGFGSGFKSFFSGSDGANYRAMLKTLKSQLFMAGVQKMKGSGALSNDEGKKIESLLGTLDTSMSPREARKVMHDILDMIYTARSRHLADKKPGYDQFIAKADETNQELRKDKIKNSSVSQNKNSPRSSQKTGDLAQGTPEEIKTLRASAKSNLKLTDLQINDYIQRSGMNEIDVLQSLQNPQDMKILEDIINDR